jgi:hypothetical protein
MRLELITDDPVVVGYLEAFEGDRELKALEALRIGIQAIRSAGPALDADLVQRTFDVAATSMRTLLETAGTQLNATVEGADRSIRSGIEAKLESTFGARGTAGAILDKYLGTNGVLHAEVMKVVGPGRDFYKRLDPSSRDGVIAQIDAVVTKRLEERLKELVGQFSLDTPDSALARLNGTILGEFRVIRDEVTKLYGEVQRAVGTETGKAEEAQKGAGKGMTFEDNVYTAVAVMAKGYDDTSENTQGTTGTIPRSKVGDALITLGETSGTPGAKIVMEFKMDAGYKLKNAQDEMATARRNREAQFGVMIFAKGYEPKEIGDYRKLGNDIYCTVDAEALDRGDPSATLYVSAAYAVARALVVVASRADAGGPNLDAIRQQADALVPLIERISEIMTKAATVRNASDSIEEICRRLQTEMRLRIAAILKESQQAKEAA